MINNHEKGCIMGKNSVYNKEKDKNYRLKLNELMRTLPLYTYDFLEEKAEKNPNTAVAYARDLIVFFEYLKDFCPPLINTNVKEIPLEFLENLSFRDINEYQKFLDESHPEYTNEKAYANSKSSIARKMCALRGFFKYECIHEEIQHDPTVGANKQTIKDEDHVIIRMTKEEVKNYLNMIRYSNVKSPHQRKLLQHTQLRDYAILFLLLNTGIRVSECVALDLNDLNFIENSMIVVRKGKKEHILYFDDELKEILLDYIENERPKYIQHEEEPALFLSTRKSRMAVRSIQEMVKKYADEIITNKKITPHKMRSTYGTALYNQTGDIRLVADVLGHSDINTTAKHYAATADERRKMAASIKPYN